MSDPNTEEPTAVELVAHEEFVGVVRADATPQEIMRRGSVVSWAGLGRRARVVWTSNGELVIRGRFLRRLRPKYVGRLTKEQLQRITRKLIGSTKTGGK